MSALGNKDIMAKNIQRLMDLHGKDRNQICKDLNIRYTTLTDWIKGNAYPRIDKIEMLANYFNVKKSELVEDLSTQKIINATPDWIPIPIVGQVVAGEPILAEENIIDYIDINPKLAQSGEFFALKVQGNSMEPVIKENDIVIIRKQSAVENGEIAVVLINGDEATLKTVKKSNNGITLIAYNVTAYEPHFYSHQDCIDLPLKIVGKVVQMMRDF